MKKIGLIGGLSWVATEEYYRHLNILTQEILGGVASSRIVLESVNRQQYVESVIDRQDEDAACAQILDAALALERAGADFIVITCNDVHRFVSKIAPQVSIPFLHIAEATAMAIENLGLHNVALLGVRKTMEGNFYRDILAEHSIQTIIPGEPDRSYIHDKIYSELVKDVFTQDTRDGFLSVIEALAKCGAEGVILGCTEIPLLLTKDQIPLPSFSTTELHCVAAVKRALATDI